MVGGLFLCGHREDVRAINERIWFVYTRRNLKRGQISYYVQQEPNMRHHNTNKQHTHKHAREYQRIRHAALGPLESDWPRYWNVFFLHSLAASSVVGMLYNAHTLGFGQWGDGRYFYAERNKTRCRRWRVLYQMVGCVVIGLCPNIQILVCNRRTVLSCLRESFWHSYCACIPGRYDDDEFCVRTGPHESVTHWRLHKACNMCCNDRAQRKPFNASIVQTISDDKSSRKATDWIL